MGKKARKMRSPKFALKAHALRANLRKDTEEVVLAAPTAPPVVKEMPVEVKVSEPPKPVEPVVETAPPLPKPKTTKRRRPSKPKVKETVKKTETSTFRNLKDILSDDPSEV
jgi:hypothetical protein